VVARGERRKPWTGLEEQEYRSYAGLGIAAGEQRDTVVQTHQHFGQVGNHAFRAPYSLGGKLS
jgi:hypothetical protein